MHLPMTLSCSGPETIETDDLLFCSFPLWLLFRAEEVDVERRMADTGPVPGTASRCFAEPS